MLKLIGIAVIMLTMVRPVSAQTVVILYVDDSVTGGNGEGDTWENAYASLHDALVDAADLASGPTVDEVRLNVAGGTYEPEEGCSECDDREDTFTMREEVRLYGGYEGVAPEDTDIDFNPRISFDDVDMGAYEQVCDLFYDLDSDGYVRFGDINHIIAAWGSCSGCPEDLDDDGNVDFEEINIILVNYCSPQTFADDLDDADLTEDDWDDYEDCMDLGTVSEGENCNCWMDHYIDVHWRGSCLCTPDCPDNAPWGPHAP